MVVILEVNCLILERLLQKSLIEVFIEHTHIRIVIFKMFADIFKAEVV